jgi:hypothetical protein
MAMLLMINLIFLPLKINILSYHMGRHRRICWFQWFFEWNPWWFYATIACWRRWARRGSRSRSPSWKAAVYLVGFSAPCVRGCRLRNALPRHLALPRRRRRAHVLRRPCVYLAPASLSTPQGGQVYLHRIRRTRWWIFYSDRIFCACAWVLCSKRIHYASSRSFSIALANYSH